MFKYIVYFIGLEFSKDNFDFIDLYFNFGFISLIVLLCFINVLGYLVNHAKGNKKKYFWVINYFNKFSLRFTIIQCFVGFSGLIILIYIGFLPFLKIK